MKPVQGLAYWAFDAIRDGTANITVTTIREHGAFERQAECSGGVLMEPRVSRFTLEFEPWGAMSVRSSARRTAA